MRIDISLKPEAIEEAMKVNARRRPCWKDLERVAEKYDVEGNRILDIGIHGDIYPGGHKYMFQSASYETLDIDSTVLPTHAGDIRDMPFEDETFDMILCIATIEHVLDNREAAYSEVYRVLKKGGTACYVIPTFIGEAEVEPAKFVSRTHLLECHGGKDYDFKMLEDDNMYLEVRK